MPGFDKTGPSGQGAMTGRGRGRCATPGEDSVERDSLGFGRGLGRGLGRGFGRGMWRGFGARDGRGFGRGMWFGGGR